MAESVEDTVRQALARLAQGRNTVQGNRLVERLKERTGLTIIEVRRGLNELRESGEVDCRDWLNGEPLGKVRLALSTPLPSETATAWAEVLRDNRLSSSEIEALMPIHAILGGFSRSDMQQLLYGLLRLREEQNSFYGVARFNISAKFLLGSSKLLDELPATALRAFGVDTGRFERFSGYVVVAGPPEPSAVVFVENPHAFETAVSSPGTDDIAWIVTFGHGLSLRDEDYGGQLADLLVNRRQLPLPLIRKGNPPSLARLLQHSKLFFWGDLDPEGLRMFERLRARYPALCLSALYQPMLQVLSTDSHPYVSATAKEGQAVWESNDPIIRGLLSRCSNRGVDQEIVTGDTVSLFCRESLRL